MVEVPSSKLLQSVPEMLQSATRSRKGAQDYLKVLQEWRKVSLTVSSASRCTKLLQSGPKGTISQRVLELHWLRFLLLFCRITSRGSRGIARSALVQMELWRVNFRSALLQNHSNARRWVVNACLLCPKHNSSFHFLQGHPTRNFDKISVRESPLFRIMHWQERLIS